MRGYRIGIVNPTSPFGQRVRQLLGEGELPVIELKLFASEGEEGATLTQFGDDVVVTQPIDPDLFPHLDALLVGGNDSDLLNRVAAQAGEADVLTLVAGALGLGAPVVTPERFEELRSSGSRLGILPRAESYLLGATLSAIRVRHPIERAVATVLVPAQSLGDPGASELHQQIVHILNYKAPPTEVLHEQLAFNARLLGASETGLSLADSVAWEASRFAGIEGALTVSLVQVPVFHAYSAALWVETKDHVDAKTIRAAFRSKPFESAKSARGAKPPSPISAAGSETIHIGPVRAAVASGPPGFWLWAVADTTAYDPASAAIEIVRSVLR
jgi:aspartate-semialdehyde dehydrogenase